MDCVTQSASPLGHNLKNDFKKSICVSTTFDSSQTFQRVILRATPEESRAEPVCKSKHHFYAATLPPFHLSLTPYHLPLIIPLAKPFVRHYNRGKGENHHEYSNRFDHGLSRVGKDDVFAALRGSPAASGLARRDIGKRLRRGQCGRDAAAGAGGRQLRRGGGCRRLL